MEFAGRFKTMVRDWRGEGQEITFTVDGNLTAAQLEGIVDAEKLRITAVKWRKKRSLDANALLWKCLGDIAASLGADKWQIYLMMLKRYGKYTYVCVRPEAVEMVKRQWRETEEVGKVEINGQEAVQLLCYYGSSTYDTKQFSTLLDGVISEMQEMGLETPASEEMRRSLEEWERKTTQP